jgi:glycosyltransferase involved in cell wall biosynthesis
MNLAEQGRILYVSMVDVTAPNGPGVNEREFLLSLYDRLGRRMHAVIPLPRRPTTEIDRARTTFYSNPRRWNPAGFLWQQLELYRIVNRLTHAGHYDLIVVRLSLIPLAFLLLSRHSTPFAIKTLGDVQGFARSRGLKGCVARVLAPINDWLFRKIVPRAVAVDCCTETHFRSHPIDYNIAREHLAHIENATNVTRFRPSDSAAAKASLGLTRFVPVLGFVGGSPAERGGLQLLELASRLAGDYPRLGVVIVGGDPDDVLKSRARNLGLEDRAVIPGVLPYEKIPIYVNSFDVGFALDQPGRMRLTGNSYQKVRQYLACGKAVVTCVEERSELAQRGLVENVAPDDLAGLELAVRSLLSRDDEARNAHAVRAPRFVSERLSTQVTLKQRLEFWEQRLDASNNDRP